MATVAATASASATVAATVASSSVYPKKAPSPVRFTKTEPRISTMVVTAHWGTTVDLASLMISLTHRLIPIWYPDEGILKFEHNNMVIGASHKDIFTNRKITSKSFFNQSTMVVRRWVPATSVWKEVNVKLFENGGVQMTGITSPEFARDVMEWLLATLQALPQPPFKEPPQILRFSVQLINTDYALSLFINQDALHKILINEYNLFSMLEKTIYQGVNTKFFYNTNNEGTGICRCSKFCKGQGTGDGDGQCKRITMSIFRTGRIIITGARELSQIRIAYDFLNGVFERYAERVLYAPMNGTPIPKAKTTSSILPVHAETPATTTAAMAASSS